MDNSYEPCSHHTQKICLFCQNNLSTGSPFKCKRFFHLSKFSQLSLNLKDAVENIWRPTTVLSGDKSPLLRNSFPSSGHQCFANMTNYRIRVPHRLLLTFLVIRKISSRVSDANKAAKKTKNWWSQNFQILCRRQTLIYAPCSFT